jgi:hypothetical protein
MHHVEFNYWIKMIMCLPYVPWNYLQDTFNNVVLEYYEKRKEDDGFEEFRMEILALVAYIERTWVGSIRVVNRRSVVSAPLFPISLWCHYDSIMESKETSNNHVEGFNSTWSRSLPANPSFQTLVEGFVHRESLAEMALREDSLAVGGNSTEARRTRKTQAEERRLDLKALLSDWDKMRREDFMDFMDYLVAGAGEI